MRTVDSLPSHLKEYCLDQDMAKYTARDHAAWRYIMKRGLPFFRKHAVSVYEDGVTKTGLSFERIPSIETMDHELQKIGWGAVGICGFIPPWAFLEFQSRRILPIATDMRSVDHIGYTPAPDIVHEAAGHAPILPDQGYADYLANYAQICCKAIYSDQDNRLYEAIRVLSDIKEKAGTSAEEIARAERGLEETLAGFTYVSEQAKVARMSWWTNEYGLTGSLEDPKIFGAGLLSSVYESQALYSKNVRKIRLSIDCINQSYDITKPQPQLFVAHDMQHLLDVLNEFAATLAFNIGGIYALNLALRAQAISTSVLDNHIAVSGKLVACETTDERIDFLRWAGPVQLSHDGRELKGQGKSRHPTGFSCPLGMWVGETTKTHEFTEDRLTKHGIGPGKSCEINYTSGFKVKGKVVSIAFNPSRTCQYLTLSDCTMTRGDQTYYQPSWGEFDLPLATSVPSVYGGPADRGKFGEHEIIKVTTTPARELPYSSSERRVFELYQALRDLRGAPRNPTKLANLADELLNSHRSEWLAQLEALELGKKIWHLDPKSTPWLSAIEENLFTPGHFSAEDQLNISEGKVLLNEVS